MMSARWRSVLMVLLGSVLAGTGCDNPDPLSSRGGVQVSFATSGTVSLPVAGLNPAPAGDTIRAGGNTLVINKAEMVLRRIELKRSDAVVCQSGSTDCQEVAIGPLLVDLPLGGRPQQALMVDVPAGSYNRVDFEVHKLTNDQSDATLRQARPDLLDRSIRVVGVFNGTAFTYESDLDVEQELPVAPPLVVSGTGGTNLTMRMVLSEWFRNAGGLLVDPSTANKGGANESIVKDNIKRSMKAFEDRDRDGQEG